MDVSRFEISKLPCNGWRMIFLWPSRQVFTWSGFEKPLLTSQKGPSHPVKVRGRWRGGEGGEGIYLESCL